MKTTKKDFETFKKECEKWIDRFGMYGWRFYFDHADIEGLRAIAWCRFPDEVEDRCFTLGLSRIISDGLKRKDILRAAFHEVMEAHHFRIRYLAKDRQTYFAEVDEEVHRLIRVLENVVFEREWR